MNMQSIAVAGFTALSAVRPLSADETDMLEQALAGWKPRQVWSREQDAELMRRRAAGEFGPAIARAMGKTPLAVKMRLHRLRKV